MWHPTHRLEFECQKKFIYGEGSPRSNDLRWCASSRFFPSSHVRSHDDRGSWKASKHTRLETQARALLVVDISWHLRELLGIYWDAKCLFASNLRLCSPMIEPPRWVQLLKEALSLIYWNRFGVEEINCDLWLMRLRHATKSRMSSFGILI